MIHFPTPFRLDKNLGKAYNQEFEKVAENDYVCLRDYDTLFLLPETITDIYGYVAQYPQADILTCYTNRNHWSLKDQLLNGRVSDNTDIMHHIDLAQQQRDNLYEATEIKKVISGFFMVISKRMWMQMKFPENLKCLCVDTRYSREVVRKGHKIYRMDGIYVWHSYRLINGVNNHKHLL